MATTEQTRMRSGIRKGLYKTFKFIDESKITSGIVDTITDVLMLLARALGVIVTGAFLAYLVGTIMSYPDGLPGLIGAYFASICQTSGRCDLPQLSGSLAVALVMAAAIFLAFLAALPSFIFKTDEEENSEIDDRLDCIQGTLDELKAEMDRRL